MSPAPLAFLCEGELLSCHVLVLSAVLGTSTLLSIWRCSSERWAGERREQLTLCRRRGQKRTEGQISVRREMEESVFQYDTLEGTLLFGPSRILRQLGSIQIGPHVSVWFCGHDACFSPRGKKSRKYELPQAWAACML